MKKMGLMAMLLCAALFTGLGVTSAMAEGMKCGPGKCGAAMMEKGEKAGKKACPDKKACKTEKKLCKKCEAQGKTTCECKKVCKNCKPCKCEGECKCPKTDGCQCNAPDGGECKCVGDCKCGNGPKGSGKCGGAAKGSAMKCAPGKCG